MQSHHRWRVFCPPRQFLRTLAYTYRHNVRSAVLVTYSTPLGCRCLLLCRDEKAAAPFRPIDTVAFLTRNRDHRNPSQACLGFLGPLTVKPDHAAHRHHGDAVPRLQMRLRGFMSLPSQPLVHKPLNSSRRSDFRRLGGTVLDASAG